MIQKEIFIEISYFFVKNENFSKPKIGTYILPSQKENFSLN